MAKDHFQNQPNASLQSGDLVLDPAIIAALPAGADIVAAKRHGVSKWSVPGYIEFQQGDSLPARWFLKMSPGDRGGAMAHGEHESMLKICQVVPDFVPRPIAKGRCSDSEFYFYLCEFHDFAPGLPDIQVFARAVAKLHMDSRSPNGKFGFHITTYNGTLKQDNTWKDSWEEFFHNGMVDMLALEEVAKGPNEELKLLSKTLLKSVIPRLLGPLESGGRRVIPRLLHGDLWIGNVATRKILGQPMIFDAAAYYGHHEYDLSALRKMNNQWSRDCLAAYHEHVPKDPPVEDWVARNALYALRSRVIDSALHPMDAERRKILIVEMEELINRFPDANKDESQ